jgi:hypothetical protein
MARIELLRPYVEKVVSEYLGIEPGKLIVNQDGTIPVSVGSANYNIRLMDGDPAVLQVYSVVLEEIQKSPELFEAINDINRNTYYAKAFWLDDNRLIVASELVAETADKGEITNACNAIAWLADHYDTELHGKFGGKMSRDDAPPADRGGSTEVPTDV